MHSPTTKQQKQQLTCPQLPLGVYREVAAHLRQVEGVDASLILRSIDCDPTAEFDYDRSQVAALQIDYVRDLEEDSQQQISEILNYYARRYSPWEDWESSK